MNIISRHPRIALAAAAALFFFVQPPAPGAPPDPTAIVVAPNKGPLVKFPYARAIRVTFPTPMVDLEIIRRAGQPSPIVFKPTVELRWIWVSQTEGKLTFPQDFVRNNVDGVLMTAAGIRSIRHSARLRPGLRDLAGNPVSSTSWGLSFSEDEFALRALEFLNVYSSAEEEEEEPETSTTAGKDDEKPQEENGKEMEEEGEKRSAGTIESRPPDAPLPAQPRVRLEFTHDVKPQDVAKAVRFQDSATNEEFPVEVNIEPGQDVEAQGWVIIEPAKPLPPGRSLLLVVDQLKEADGSSTIPHLLAIPAGTTFAPEIKAASAYHQPLKGAFIRIIANQTIDGDAANLKHVLVEPAVPDVNIVPTGNGLEILGKFKTGIPYKLTLKAGLLTHEGFRLEKDSVWDVTVGQKRPTIVLPESYIFRRAASPSVRCEFVQVNTEGLDWKIASIPRDKLSEVRKRQREFGYYGRKGDDKVKGEEEKEADADDQTIKRDPKTGEFIYRPTELLIPTLGLPLLASGKFDASGGDLETPRELEWTPPNRDPGLFLLEISGKDSRGRIVGNRAIISRGDWIITVLDLPEANIVRVSSMDDGKPVRGVPVELLGEDINTGPLMTNEKGEAFFAGKNAVPLGWRPSSSSHDPAILVGESGRACIQLTTLPYFPSGSAAVRREVEGNDTECVIVTDRNVYRPGEVLKFKAFVRKTDAARLAIPAGEKVSWRISTAYTENLNEITAVVSATGSFEGEWKVPPDAYGEYYIQAENALAKITVVEYRPPPFSVEVASDNTQGDTVRATVRSMHFHGAPNAGAKVRWKAEWIVDDWRRDEWYAPGVTSGQEDAQRFALVLNDEHSADAPTRGLSKDIIEGLRSEGWSTALEDREVRIAATGYGETTLNAQGTATIESKTPLPAGVNYGRAKLYWIVDVTSADTAQNQRGGKMVKVQFVPQILGVNLEQAGPRKLSLQVGSFDAVDRPASGLMAKAEVFSVEVNTAKERIADGIHRYRNTPTFEKVWEGTLTTPAQQTIPVKTGGNYVVRVTAPSQPGTPQVSDAVMLEDDEEKIFVAVDNESSLQVTADKERYNAGETAMISVQSPFTGTANVTVQDELILSQQTVEFKGNTHRIPVPILASFAPNAFVCVHLIKPAAGGSVPGERFGYCELKVDRPDQHLQVVPTFVNDSLEPGETARGTVKVSADGKPIAGAEVLVFAVDEAVLALGRWQLPDFFQAFFPRRQWQVTTRTALGKLWTPEKPEQLSHSQKGFILGDAGPLVADITFRRDAIPLAFWKADLRTTPNGEVPFEFKAPDGLTSYRLVAVAQKGVEQFGAGRAMLRLSKKLQVEPALPAFLRNGDEVTLRATIRQEYADSDAIDVAIVPDAGIILTEPGVKRVDVARGQPLAVGFRGKAASNAVRAKISFAAKSAGHPEIKDGEEHSFVVHPPVIERREAVTGTVTAAKPFDVGEVTPARWLQQNGRCDVLLSGSTFLPKLAGLPKLLEAQGSLEKVSSRILAATLLAAALDTMPLASGTENQLREKVRDGLARLAQSTLEDGGMPSWPGTGKGAASRDDWTTIEAAWAIRNAARRGFEVDERLATLAHGWLQKIVKKEEGFDDLKPALRCFALMAYGSTLAADGTEAQAAKEFKASAGELFDRRAELKLTVEDRAWLALGLHFLGILPDQQKTLLRELDQPINEALLDPAMFGTKTRAEAVRFFAKAEIESSKWSKDTRQNAIQAFERITRSSLDLSTHENLWLLLALNSLTRGDIPAKMATRQLVPKPTASSRNKFTAAWLDIPLDKLSTTFALPMRPGVAGSYLLNATYRVPESEAPLREPGFSLVRSERNLTDPARTGTQATPWKAGDRILVSYQLELDQAHSHLEIEDQLPACLETVNPDLPPIVENFKLSTDAGVNTLKLSHVELRFARTLLYFENGLPGRNVYSVLAQVIVPGTFRWPATQARPMYDNRFSSTSAAAVVHVE
ncbi:MAG: alpha-2-macroglobulin [Verrucomicrobiota bacterium]